jgi:hypothetical protein
MNEIESFSGTEQVLKLLNQIEAKQQAKLQQSNIVWYAGWPGSDEEYLSA